MNPMLRLIAGVLAVVAAALAVNPPDYWKLFGLGVAPIPGSIDLLHTAQVIPVPGALGPESLAFDPTGDGPYTGVADGRVLKWDRNDRRWTDFAVTTSQRTGAKLYRSGHEATGSICSRETEFRGNLL